MRSIPLLAVDSMEVFDEIAAAKHQPRRERMRAARADVLVAYQSYEDVAPEVGDLDEAPLTDLQKEAMRHAFSVETEPMTALRGDLLKRVSVARCPFCGISESSTVDHYLPKEKYPEFSVFPKNLVPSCAVCNTRKRDRILDEGTNVRMFLHPCYDAIPDVAFLAAYSDEFRHLFRFKTASVSDSKPPPFPIGSATCNFGVTVFKHHQGRVVHGGGRASLATNARPTRWASRVQRAGCSCRPSPALFSVSSVLSR